MKEYVVAIATVIDGYYREAGEPVTLDTKKFKIYGDAGLVVTPEEWEKLKPSSGEDEPEPKAAKAEK